MELWAAKKRPTQEEIDVIYDQMLATISAFNRANINYHLVAGSALGQARHGGFIPWDDDIDFGIHRNDQHRFWEQRDFLASMGFSICHADIGFKMGTGELIKDALTDIDGVLTAGCRAPFTGVNQDIFFFDEDSDVNGVPVLRYTCERARTTWPGEVIPVSGWYAPATGTFGGFSVNILPDEQMEWYLTSSYGTTWKTHDGSGKRIDDAGYRCALHSSMLRGASEPRLRE